MLNTEHTKRQVYINAKPHNVYHRCLWSCVFLFLFLPNSESFGVGVLQNTPLPLSIISCSHIVNGINFFEPGGLFLNGKPQAIP